MQPIIGITCLSIERPRLFSGMAQSYVDAVTAAGGAPLLIPIGLGEVALTSIAAAVDGLLLPGGVDIAPERYGQSRHPALGPVDEVRDELELAVTRIALSMDMPILGICRGIQTLAVAAGGTLYQDLASQGVSELRHHVPEHGRDHLAHEIAIEPASRLARVITRPRMLVNTFHHQAVASVPPGFAVSALAPDNVIEAMESERHTFVIGVQCHPEETWNSTAPEFSALFLALVEAAAIYRAGRTAGSAEAGASH